MSGIRGKQIDLEDLYKELDPRFSSAGITKDVTVSNKWTNEGNYYVQTVSLDGINADSKLIVQSKQSIDDSYEENLEKENLFSHIVKIISNENSLTIYSCKELEVPFEIQVLYFN